MDGLLEDVLLTFPPEKRLSTAEYDKEAAAYVKKLGTISSSTWAQSTSKDNILNHIDPSRNSIAYLCALRHHVTSKASSDNDQDVLERLVVFFTQYDSVQIRYAGKDWQELYTWSINFLKQQQSRDIAFLGEALNRLGATPFLTTSHLNFVRLCLDSAVPSIACIVLDHDIHVYPTSRNAPSSTDGFTLAPAVSIAGELTPEIVLEYYLLGAQTYIGLSNWKRARLFLEYVLSHPNARHATSTFQVEAYKKWTLLGLLTTGSSFPFLRSLDSFSLKDIRSISKPYDVLADTFKSRDWRRFEAERDAGTNIWAEDGNARLVRAVSSALYVYCVSDLQKTYAALPITLVAKHLTVPPAEAYDNVRRMIEQGRLKAALINTSSSLATAALRFDTTQPAQPSTSEIDLEAQTRRIEALVTAIQDADRRSQLSTEYLDMMKRNKRQNAENDPADQMDLEWTAPSMLAPPNGEDADEDIMA